uniref:Uncharacterized protein n=1 Tax=Amphimedon queenslandica TaxID=400682 RepID=A0A1X7UZP5_AMPQE
MKEFLIVLLMSLVMGTVYFMPFHISLLGQFLSNTNYIKQLLVICQTLKNCLIVMFQGYIYILLMVMSLTMATVRRAASAAAKHLWLQVHEVVQHLQNHQPMVVVVRFHHHQQLVVVDFQDH